ncbi:MAG: hypothetical protein H7323_03810 [Frankiales bacterium]|nr:hypothetical protein [Frankiales bacterium]
MLLHPRRIVTLVQSLSLLLAPHGGQHLARRNAWGGMSRDAALGRDRREAELALGLAAAQAGLQSSAAR